MPGSRDRSLRSRPAFARTLRDLFLAGATAQKIGERVV